VAKSGNLKDKVKRKMVFKELENFNNLVKGHEKLLEAIGRL